MTLRFIMLHVSSLFTNAEPEPRTHRMTARAFVPFRVSTQATLIRPSAITNAALAQTTPALFARTGRAFTPGESSQFVPHRFPLSLALLAQRSSSARSTILPAAPLLWREEDPVSEAQQQGKGAALGGLSGCAAAGTTARAPGRS